MYYPFILHPGDASMNLLRTPNLPPPDLPLSASPIQSALLLAGGAHRPLGVTLLRSALFRVLPLPILFILSYRFY